MTDITCGSICHCGGKLVTFHQKKGDYMLRCNSCGELYVNLSESDLAMGWPEYQSENSIDRKRTFHVLFLPK